jgi:uncharacterized membrane protein YukC
MKKKWTIKKIIKTVWITVGLIFILWLFYSYQSKGVDQEFLHDSKTTKVG